ncbi:hypothetical protein SAMN05192558_109276 [Actinokineospora alba]|uniref:Fibronectin type-III domain-containing protein n=1 Tax=Actinokineospora alba TaxID=504798 RepID=A0A1H0T6T9_9PSEU|nr:fibronectin type III domain-containing protein [Actinokineospora alba]TDP66361.1 hypothetical protein C8E96_1865 [Actinokineospora alba]SDJ22924.1 hypothetical protein SAMN05421871_11199 [Actinokineospora alba]SDP49186.1 hypothetical protein SAMN05192558_109276 [Actinokineospora alba]
MDLQEPALPKRRTLRRVAIVAGGLAVIGAAIALLRTPEPVESGPRPVPPPQTTVKEFAADGIVLPAPGNPPAQPASLSVVPGPQRLLVAWGPERTGKPEPDRAAGYEIRWGRGTTLTNVRLLSQPVAQLDALENGTSYQVEVRTVDAFGRRSLPAVVNAEPKAPDNDSAWSFVDRFSSRVVPEPQRWRLGGTSDCGRATRGEGNDGKRMVISGQCGTEPLVLRPRAPFKLRDSATDGELGRVVVETDHPGQAGELTIDLVPGPADLVGGPFASSQEDPTLPPGSIRVRVTGEATAFAEIRAAPGMARSGVTADLSPMAPAEIGITVRWEVVVRTDGVRLVRDGKVVAASDAVVAWREATVLVGFIGGPTGLHAAVDLIAFLGAPTAAPVLVVPPVLDTGRSVVEAGSGLVTPSGGARVQGTTGGQLRVTLVPTNRAPTEDQFTVEVGGREFPARPAVAGQTPARGVRYPIVADVPADALVLRADSDTLPIRVRGPIRRGEGAARVVSASVELAAPPGAVSAASGSGTDVPLALTRIALARPSARFLDAAGQVIGQGGVVPRGRLVLEVTADGPGGQRLGGELAGLAGIEVRLDDQRIAGIPTVADGPGTAGVWRLAVDTTGMAAGEHVIEIKAIGVDPRAAFAVAYAPFRV